MALPSGTVTFLFTDIEGSTKLSQTYHDQWETMRARHHAILHKAVQDHNGHVFQIIGDEFCVAFHTAIDAMRAAADAQRMLFTEPWDPAPIKVRMGIHSGTAHVSVADDQLGGYTGYIALARVSRLRSAGHGGQVLVSLSSEELVRDELPEDISLRDMGPGRLKDLVRPEQIFQLIISGLPADFPPLKTLDAYHHNLPTQMTNFIGRGNEMQEIKQAVSNQRLVTLTGTGGTGKTRIALQVAADLLDQFSDGIWLVELAPVLDPSLVPRTTAQVLGLRYEPQRPILDMLCDYLHEKNMLILLDNCEHLVDACAHMVDRILHTAPNVRILASSREALGISGEVIYRVPSLGLPDVDHLPPLDSLSQFEAVKLFIDRAGFTDPSFTLTKVNAPFIAQICHRLDGIPLALELAAAKVHALGVEQTARRLDDRFRLLTGGSRTALERHQTLRATLDWSYNLLLPGEQVLFRRLSVFINGWTLEAAESVCEEKTGPGSIMGNDILNLLEQLINKSLVSVEEMQGGARYRILETTRQYANEKLVESGESDALRDKHLAYFLTLVETAEPHLRRAEQVEWFKRLDAELENLRASLAWALHRPLAIFVLRLAGALGRYWDISVFWKEGAKWLDHALGREWDETSQAERAARGKAFYHRALIAEKLDEVEIWETSASSALTLCEQVGDAWGTAYARVMVASHRINWGDMTIVEQLIKASMDEFQKLGDTWGESYTHGLLGVLYLRTEGKAKEYAEVQPQYIALARKAGDRYELADGLTRQATVHIYTSEWDQADMDLQEADQLIAELHLPRRFAFSGLQRAYLLFGRGERENAKSKLLSVVDWCRQVGEKNLQSMSLHLAGSIAELEGNLPGSLELCKNSLNVAREAGLHNTLALISAVLGRLSYLLHDRDNALQYATESLDIVKHNQTGPNANAFIFLQISEMNVDFVPTTAVQLIGYSEKIFQRLPLPKNPILVQPLYDRLLAAARTKLSETEFASAWETGSKMSQEEAVELAIKSLDDL